MNQFSYIGNKLSSGSGIGDLMVDLGDALSSGKDLVMLGGGNPAHIPEVEAAWRRRLEEIMSEAGSLEKMLGDYDSPQGNPVFLEAVAEYFSKKFGWKITAENVCVTAGSQTAFFLLFNLLAGESPRGFKKVLFPRVPEYIGYADQGMQENMLVSCRPKFKTLGEHEFTYELDFDAIQLDDTISCACISRPSNPSSHVATDDEMNQLHRLCRENGKYLIVDQAYGAPFPGVVYSDVKPLWDESVINVFSLSKLGLPTLRTGIVIAEKEIVRRLSAMNAVVSLANNTPSQTIVAPMLTGGEMDVLCQNHVKPFYQSRAEKAFSQLIETWRSRFPYRVHSRGGAFFMWIWLEGCPLDDRELYRRFKEKNVIVVPGSYFFMDQKQSWKHSKECFRMSYGFKPEDWAKGFELMAEEIEKLYEASP